ncbi:hypothetical protein DSO57_1020718 [Entomophthora muscae]|uniref:Uncharacterized protein n=1 Tax=Entomophthora muscae TaxID=34485 RepID=A0ACC2UCI2_9FUNG|nr:hypothetical protein DSO57_1020718 [Entomophthora muscae]
MWFDDFRLRYSNEGTGLDWETDCSLLPDSILYNPAPGSDGVIDPLGSRLPPPAPTRPRNLTRVYKDPPHKTKDIEAESHEKRNRQVRLTSGFFNGGVCPAHLPFSGEINAIVNLFLAPCSPLELNLSYVIKRNALVALKSSSEPDMLLGVAFHVHQMLLTTSFPAFLEFVQRNRCGCGQVRRMTIPVFLWIVNIVFMTCMVALDAPRWPRVLVFPLFFVSLMLFFLSWSGPCLIQLCHIVPTSLRCSSTHPAPSKFKVIEKSLSSSSGVGKWGKDPFFDDPLKPPSLECLGIARDSSVHKQPCSLSAKTPEENFQFTNLPLRNAHIQHKHGWLCLFKPSHFLISTSLAFLLTLIALLFPTFPIQDDPIFKKMFKYGP